MWEEDRYFHFGEPKRGMNDRTLVYAYPIIDINKL